jgi:WD40 repeat protein
VEYPIWSIDIDKNEEYLFVLPVEGPLVQFCTATNFHRDWDRNIVCFRLTRNGKYLFGQDEDNHLKQWNVQDQSLVHDWKPLHDGSDYFFKVSKDDKNIWSRDNSGYLKQWNIESKFVRNWGIVLDGKILSNTTSKNGKKMYTIGLDRCIRIWDIKKQKILCKWEVAAIEGEQDQTNLILFIKGKFLFLLSRNGQLYQYSEKKRALVKNGGPCSTPASSGTCTEFPIIFSNLISSAPKIHHNLFLQNIQNATQRHLLQFHPEHNPRVHSCRVQKRFYHHRL